MTRPRTIVSTLVLVTALLAAAPDAAPAGSLLSGYGGPGQGNQAILGSALLNGPRGGGGGSTGPGASLPGGVTNAGTQAPRGGASSQLAPSTGRGDVLARGGAIGPGGAQRSQARLEGASGGASGAYPVSERSGSALPSETLGLSGEDLLYILLALGALAFTGVMTRRLTRTMMAAGRHGS
jgi:hypothetical protein